MADIRTTGVIIKQSDYGEGHRMLSIFTAEYGIIKAVSYGARKAKSSRAASSQLLCCGEFELYAGNRDIAVVNNIDIKDGFSPIYEDIEKLALCNYFTEITYCMLGENNPDERLLRVFLNTLYALAYRDDSIKKIKAVYELKLMALSGYMPDMTACMGCGSETVCAFDTAKGGMVCVSCAGKDSVFINRDICRAITYITTCEDKKMLSFTGNDELFDKLNEIAEKYILVQTDKKFISLAYFKTIVN